MKDEIREILNHIKYFKENYKCPIDIKDIITTNELFKLLDYITNLQQIEQDHQKLNGELREELEDYKSRNEKAIEYIKHFENQDWYVEGCQIKDLKNILQGDDKE